MLRQLTNLALTKQTSYTWGLTRKPVWKNRRVFLPRDVVNDPFHFRDLPAPKKVDQLQRSRCVSCTWNVVHKCRKNMYFCMYIYTVYAYLTYGRCILQGTKSTGKNTINHTVDGWIPTPVDMVNFPFIHGVLAPTQVVVGDFFHQDYQINYSTWALPETHSIRGFS